MPRSRHLSGMRYVVVPLAVLSLLETISAQDSKPDSSCEVRITVVDRDTETPLPRARVEVVRFPDVIIGGGFTDTEGTFVTAAPSPGSYQARVYLNGYADVDTSFVVYSQQDTTTLSVHMEGNRRAATSSSKVSAAALKRPRAAVKEFERGMELLETKDFRGSVPHFENAIATVPDYYEAYFLMGIAQVQLGSIEKGGRSLSKAVELAPDFLPPYYPLTVVLYSEGKFEEENALLRKATELSPNDWRWPFEMARSLARLQQWPQALEYATKAHENRGAPTKAHLLLGDLCKHNGQPAKAMAEYEDFLRLDPKSPLAPRAQEALKELRAVVAQLK